jgi:hypothetical protein
MTESVSVDLPHKLGKAAARGRIEHGVGRIAEFVPGGNITERHWEGDTMHFTVEAMGQRISSRLDVQDANVHAEFELPGFLSMFANQIRAALQKNGPKLLE